MTTYDKLVRDAIPEIIRESGDPEELADVLAVVAAIEDAEGFERAELERLRERKADERGGFSDGGVLERVK